MKTNFKGTKGEWYIESTFPDLATHIQTNEFRIAEVKHYENHPRQGISDPTAEEGMANAKLICKAPELLELLEKYAFYHNCEQEGISIPTPEQWYELHTKTIELIKQATEL